MKNIFKTVLLTVFSVSLITFMVSSCKKEDTSVPEPEANPITIDTCGTRYFTYLANGHVKVYDYSHNGTTFEVTTTISDFGSNGEFKTLYSSTVWNGFSYEKECGGWLYESSTYPIPVTRKNRKALTHLNETWTDYDSTLMSDINVIAKNVSVTVPAGTFSCDILTVHQHGAPSTDTIFYNNSLGNIKCICNFNYELKSKNF